MVKKIAKNELFKFLGSFLVILLASFGLSSCANGHRSQTADQVAAVNGAYGTKDYISIQNALIRKTSDNKYELVASITNNDITNEEFFEGVEGLTDDIKFNLKDKIKIPALGELSLGNPVNSTQESELKTLDGLYESKNHAVILVNSGMEKIKPGLTINITFSFNKVGVITIPVPLSSDPTKA